MNSEVAKVDVNTKALSLGQEQLQKNLIKWQDHVQKYEGSLESAFKTYSSIPAPPGTLGLAKEQGLSHVSTKLRVGKLRTGTCFQASQVLFHSSRLLPSSPSSLCQEERLSSHMAGRSTNL